MEARGGKTVLLKYGYSQGSLCNTEVYPILPAVDQKIRGHVHWASCDYLEGWEFMGSKKGTLEGNGSAFGQGIWSISTNPNLE